MKKTLIALIFTGLSFGSFCLSSQALFLQMASKVILWEDFLARQLLLRRL